MAAPTNAVTLETAEQQAVSKFLDDNWLAFEKTAKQYLTAEEIEALGDKLADFG